MLVTFKNDKNDNGKSFPTKSKGVFTNFITLASFFSTSSHSLITIQRNFQEISLKENRISLHFFVFDDRCLYKHSSAREGTKYLKCFEQGCNCNGKIVKNVFSRTNAMLHAHPNHQNRADYEIAFERLRNAVRASRQPVKLLHQQALRCLF